jgi:hypothetical protein
VAVIAVAAAVVVVVMVVVLMTVVAVVVSSCSGGSSSHSGGDSSSSSSSSRVIVKVPTVTRAEYACLQSVPDSCSLQTCYMFSCEGEPNSLENSCLHYQGRRVN